MRKFVLALSFSLCTVLPAAAAETLTIYTYESFVSEWGPGPQVKKAFEAQCGCTVDFVGVEDGVAILNRLKLEGASAKADIALGLDNNLIAEAKATGFFAESGVDTSRAELPIDWSQEKVFVPFDYGWFAFVYDTEKIATPPKSLAELVDGDPVQKIVIEDPRTSTPGLGLLLWVKAVYGDKAAEAWAKLKPRVLTVTPGWSEAYGLFTKGEAPMVLSYSTSPAYHIIEEKTERYQAAPFSEGHYLQIEVAGMLANSQHKELARKFLDFMLTPAFQDAIPTRNWMLPAAETTKPLPDAFKKFDDPSMSLVLPSEEVAANRKAWIDEWLQAMSK